MRVENPIFEQERARNRIFPGWWTSMVVNPRHLQPLYIVRCQSAKEFFEAHSVKPSNVRAEIISPDFPGLVSSSNQELNRTVIASDLIRNMGLAMFLGGIGIAVSTSETSELIQSSESAQVAYGAVLAVIGAATVRSSTRLARHAIAEARSRGLNVAKGFVYRQLSKRFSGV